VQCIGFIIPLMDAMYANYYTREVMIILIREFQTPDEEMKKIVLKVVAQCVGTEGVEPDYIRQVGFSDRADPCILHFSALQLGSSDVCSVLR
jgi:hypothetical protein